MKETYNNLKEIHKSLLDFQGQALEKIWERKLGPYDLWHLSLNDSNFSWLRRISELMALIDEEDEKEAPNENFPEFVKHELTNLFFDKTYDQDFQMRLDMALAKDPTLYLLMVNLKQSIEELH